MAERRARAQNKNIKIQKSNVCILFLKRTHRAHTHIHTWQCTHIEPTLMISMESTRERCENENYVTRAYWSRRFFFLLMAMVLVAGGVGVVVVVAQCAWKLAL